MNMNAEELLNIVRHNAEDKGIKNLHTEATKFAQEACNSLQSIGQQKGPIR